MRHMNSECYRRVMEIDPIIRSLATRKEFVGSFWRELYRRRIEGEKVSQEDVFDDLSARYEETFGEPLFPSFEAFRKYRDRRR